MGSGGRQQRVSPPGSNGRMSLIGRCQPAGTGAQPRARGGRAAMPAASRREEQPGTEQGSQASRHQPNSLLPQVFHELHGAKLLKHAPQKLSLQAGARGRLRGRGGIMRRLQAALTYACAPPRHYKEPAVCWFIYAE